MFPTQPRRWPQTLAAIVALIWLFNNPAQAAEFVNKAVAALTTFANGLG